jgi:hypothetical protein
LVQARPCAFANCTNANIVAFCGALRAATSAAILADSCAPSCLPGQPQVKSMGRPSNWNSMVLLPEYQKNPAPKENPRHEKQAGDIRYQT